MNILFLSTENPYPPDHGHHLRTYNTLKALAAQHNVFFIGFASDPREVSQKSEIEKFCSSVDIILLPNQRWRKYAAMAANLFSALPYTVARYVSAEARSRLKQILSRHAIDVVHFDLPHVAAYIKDIAHLPKILTNHNVESLRLLRWARVEKNLLAKLYLYDQYRKLHRYEGRLCPLFDRCITVSETDKRILMEMCKSDNFTTVPNGVDIDYFRPGLSANGKIEGIVWVGSMQDVNNRDAVDYFLTDIAPGLIAGLSDVKMTFVGASPTRLLQKMASENGNIRIAGYVNDIRPYVDAAAVFIAPLRSGSGTKLKVLNAMAQAKPVVTTSIGAEGIEAIPGEEIVIADQAQEFAERVIALLKNPGRARDMGLRARKCIESLYDWKSITASMNAIYEAARARNRNQALSTERVD